MQRVKQKVCFFTITKYKMESKETKEERSGNIKVFLRARPTAKAFEGTGLQKEESVVSFEFAKDETQGLVNNARQRYQFKFDGIFDMDANQEDIFNNVAKPVIDDAMKGINGTIFAYGQTGSGKTYTITGGSERYVDRGIIPRTVSDIFSKINQDGGATYKVYISYLEIYLERGFDLLSREDSATSLEDLPKVYLREDEDGHMHLKNLSVNMAPNEEEALNLLFLGDTNRVVAETPMNDASTRSHCMFIIWIEKSQHGSDTVKRSKIHLVDLAGSERISKTNVGGKLLNEAKYINTSLHFLEQVIVALQERCNGHRSHIPYRNSMMTSVLRDSLGGNCKTVMVANVALETSNIDESIGTCRFAQRVALIRNDAIVNEEIDPQTMIRRLKREVEQLKGELKALGGEEEDTLTDEKKCICKKLVEEFADDRTLSNIVCGGRLQTQFMFEYMRELIFRDTTRKQVAAHDDMTGSNGMDDDSEQSAELQKQIKHLRLELAQRDQEIGILVEIVNKQKANTSAPTSSSKAPAFAEGGANLSVNNETLQPPPLDPSITGGRQPPSNLPSGKEAAALLLDRNKAFEVFRKSVRRSETFEENKNLLRTLFSRAKSLGLVANEARERASAAKNQLQKIRATTALEGSDDTVQPENPETEKVRTDLEKQKKIYTDSTNELRNVKGDIERVQKMMEQCKDRLRRDFEQWYGQLTKEATSHVKKGGSDVNLGVAPKHE